MGSTPLKEYIYLRVDFFFFFFFFFLFTQQKMQDRLVNSFHAQIVWLQTPTLKEGSSVR